MHQLVCITLAIIVLQSSALAQDAAPATESPPTPAAQPTPADTNSNVDAEQDTEEDAKPKWNVSLSGYFRAPVMLGISRRPRPASTSGERELQLSYAPNRVVDANYSSFAYTRLEEGDWAEVYVSAKRPHVEATIALMGRWYTWAGYEDGAASWLPSQAWVQLSTDVELGRLEPHLDLKGGVFWQRWGMFDKYDTYLFGRFHQAGAAVEAHVPFAGGGELRLVEGFGTNRNGAPGVGTGLTLLHYTHAGVRLGKWLDAGAYHNLSWTRDPQLFVPAEAEPTSPLPNPGPNGEPGGGPYDSAQAARMHVLGADINLRLSVLGHVWVAASHIDVKNGWALPGIVEVMHSPGGSGIAENYLGFGETGSSGSGSMRNLAWLYENSVASLHGRSDGTLPDLKLSVFGMFARTRRELEPGATIPDRLTQLKWGSDLTLALLPWFACMLRVDSVDLDSRSDGGAFRAISPRIIFTSHALATESVWLQYSRYFYDDDVRLETSVSQPYPNPDRHVVKLQANLTF
jgi:hypothetical protein